MLTMAEVRRLLKSMDGAKKDEFILAWFKRLNKQDKEMFTLVLQAIAENKEAPSAKAILVDDRKTKKIIGGLYQKLYRYRRRYTGRVATAVRKEIRDLLHDLPMMPIQADGYDEICRQYRQLYLLLCDASMSTPWGGLFEGTSRNEVFRTLCSMQLANGIRPAVLDELVETAEKSYMTSWNEKIEMFEIVTSFIRNGDLRFEMIESQEQKVREKAQAWDEHPSDRSKDSLLAAILFLFTLMEQEGALHDPSRYAHSLCEPAIAREAAERWNHYQLWLDVQEKQRLEEMDQENDFDY